MGEVVNLRRYRKAKEKAEAEALAAENRSKFGRTKGEREQDAKAEEKAERHLDAHLREPGGSDADE